MEAWKRRAEQASRGAALVVHCQPTMPKEECRGIDAVRNEMRKENESRQIRLHRQNAGKE